MCLLISCCMLQQKINRHLGGFQYCSAQRVGNGYHEHQRYSSVACETTLIMGKNIADRQLKTVVSLMHWVETLCG